MAHDATLIGRVHRRRKEADESVLVPDEEGDIFEAVAMIGEITACVQEGRRRRVRDELVPREMILFAIRQNFHGIFMPTRLLFDEPAK
jgi:hypothetical protein